MNTVTFNYLFTLSRWNVAEGTPMSTLMESLIRACKETILGLKVGDFTMYETWWTTVSYSASNTAGPASER